MDTDWDWVADVYRDVPRARSESVTHAIAATAQVQLAPRTGAGVWWLGAGAAAAIGWLMLSRLPIAPFQSPPTDRAAAPPTVRAASPAPDVREHPPATTNAPESAKAPLAVAPAPQPIAPTEAPEIASQTSPSLSGRDTMLAPETRNPVVSVPIEIAGVSNADVERLRAGLGDAGVRGLEALLRRAEADGLPRAPLIDRAMGGLAHAAPSSVILTAVEQRANALRLAQGALGAGAPDAELIAGADALDAGAAVRELTEVRRRFPRGRATAALLTLAGLVTDGVPAADAADALRQGANAGMSDAALLALRTGVTADVARGIPPLAALRARIESLGEESSDPRFRRPEPVHPLPGDVPRAP